MNITSVRKLVEAGHHTTVLQAAEEAIINGSTPLIDVEGSDEGDQLTHIMAATWVVRHMQTNDTDVMSAIREYTKKVRSSIS